LSISERNAITHPNLVGMYVDNLIDVRLEACRYFRNKKKERLKFRNLELTVIPKISEVFIGTSVTLGRVTNLKLI